LKKKEAGTSSFLLNTLQDDRHLKIFSEFCYSSELTLFSKGMTLQILRSPTRKEGRS